MKISAELSDKIQQTIDEFVSDSEPFLIASEHSDKKLDLRKIAAEINILPIAFDWFASWGIRSGGTILFFFIDKPYEIKIVENQKILNMVLFRTAQKYFVLAELMPVRNPESIVCLRCGGTGIVKEFAENEFLANSVNCKCGGVGWLPSADPKYLYFGSPI